MIAGDDIAAILAEAATAESPPQDWPQLAAALWWEAHGEWERAHGIAQGDASPVGAQVHAYLHRVEGDLANAGYWYRRARVPEARSELADERLELAKRLLGDA